MLNSSGHFSPPQIIWHSAYEIWQIRVSELLANGMSFTRVKKVMVGGTEQPDAVAFNGLVTTLG